MILTVSSFIEDILAREATLSSLISFDENGLIIFQYTSDYAFESTGLRFLSADVLFYNDLSLGFEIYLIGSIGEKYDFTTATGHGITISIFDTTFTQVGTTGYFFFTTASSVDYNSLTFVDDSQGHFIDYKDHPNLPGVYQTSINILRLNISGQTGRIQSLTIDPVGSLYFTAYEIISQKDKELFYIIGKSNLYSDPNLGSSY